MLLPVLDPAHRPPEPSRQKRDDQILGVDMTLEAEPATDIERQTPHPRFRQAQDRGDLAAHPMHNLGRRPDRYRIGPRVVDGDDTAALDRHRRVAVVIEPALQSVRRAGHRGSDIAFGNRKRAEEVGAQMLVDQRRVGGECRFGVDDRRQLFEVESTSSAASSAA